MWASPQKRGRDPYRPQTIMRRCITPAARAAGITKRIGWHTFWHTFSTLIKSLGVDAKVVQELMRHASFRTTAKAPGSGTPGRSCERLSRDTHNFVVGCCGDSRFAGHIFCKLLKIWRRLGDDFRTLTFSGGITGRLAVLDWPSREVVVIQV